MFIQKFVVAKSTAGGDFSWSLCCSVPSTNIITEWSIRQMLSRILYTRLVNWLAERPQVGVNSIIGHIHQSREILDNGGVGGMQED